MLNFLSKIYNNLDFPYYNHNPRIPEHGWLIIVTTLILSFFVSDLFYAYSEFLSSMIQVIIIAIPLLYYSNWNYSLLIHKPDKDEIYLAVSMFVMYILYALIVTSALDILGLSGIGGAADDYVPIETLISLIFSMMVEELLKFIPLMLFMRLFYKYSQNRNASFILASIIMLVGFGLLHYGSGVTIYSVLLLQGLGSSFELYGYYKTKNLIVPYISHLLTDVFLMGITMITF